MSCPGCNKEGFHTKYMGEVGRRMDSTGECFDCAFWELRCEEGQPVVIDGWTYGIGPEPKDLTRDKSMLGMSGRRFDIEFLADGKKITTHNLWCGGEIPERHRSRLPNTARFLGASREKVGETNCWNPVKESEPAYPPYA